MRGCEETMTHNKLGVNMQPAWNHANSFIDALFENNLFYWKAFCWGKSDEQYRRSLKKYVFKEIQSDGLQVWPNMTWSMFSGWSKEPDKTSFIKTG